MKKSFLGLTKLIIVVILGLAATTFIYVYFLLRDLPVLGQIEQRQLAQSTKIYDRTGQILLYEIHGDEKRTIISSEEIPDYLKKATIAVEDDDFYTHPAFDWRAILRAFFSGLIHGRITQGGSTITQQLAKNSFLTPEKTIQRKIKELILSIQLEKQYTKDEILNLYLNQIPYGADTYGIEAAAQTFFEKSIKDINLAESALIAALPKAPSYYSPWGPHAKELKQRQEFILNKMQQLEMIDAEQLEQAIKTPLIFASPKIGNIKAPHFVMEVKEYLNNHYGEDMVEKGGLKVITTLDYELQTQAEKAISEGVSRNEKLYQGKNGALVAQDAKTGQILALVGSRDYFDIKNEGNFNVASQGLRQPGSALKPFVYLAAFKKGLTPETIIFDTPTEFTANNPNCPLTVDFNNENPKCYHPQNYDKLFRGPISLKEALAQSINVPAVKILYLVGINQALGTLQKFGASTLTEPLRYGLSLVLGGGEIKLTELVGAYSVLSQEGIKRPQTMILKIENSKGETLEEYQEKKEQVIEPLYPQLINIILSDKDLRQPLFSSSLNLTVFPDYEVALKTGTTSDYRDAWAIGYTPSLVVGVWAGNNNNQPMQRYGGSILAAVPIWSSFMKEALKNQPSETFTRPNQILPEKPILRGEAIIKYKINNIEYPQLHNILFYIDKDNPLGPAPDNPEKDPQFKNWEEALIDWAKINISDFYRYNQIPPKEAVLITNTPKNNGLEILNIQPQNGEFINNPFDFKATVKSDNNLDKIELYLNNQLIDYRKTDSAGIYEYQYRVENKNLENQNLIKISIADKSGTTLEKEIIIFLK